MVETRPFTSMSASIVTSPLTRCVRAMCGYVGGTDESNRATFTSPPIGSGAAGPLPLPRRPRLLESAGVAAFIANPGSAVPFSESAALRVTFGAARRTWPNAGFFAVSSTTSSAGEFAGGFAGARLFMALTAAGLAPAALAEGQLGGRHARAADRGVDDRGRGRHGPDGGGPV